MSVAQQNLIIGNDVAEAETDSLLIDQEMWDAVFPAGQESACKAIGRGIADDLDIRLAPHESLPGQITMTVNTRLFHAKSVFNPASMRMHADDITVTYNARGTGIGRAFMRNQMEFCRSAGYKGIDITAGGTSGAYCWARYGFLPQKNAGLFGSREFRADIDENYRRIKPLLSDTDTARIEALLQMKNETDIADLAALPIDLAQALRASYDQAVRNDTRYEKFTPDQRMATRFLEHLGTGRVVPAGAAILSMTHWQGYIDFDNARQMQRINDYLRSGPR